MFQKVVTIDGRNHLLGRLASVVAKELLRGQRVVVVRCEDINMSGSFFRNKLKYLSFLRKRVNTNPKQGPFHYRAPSRMFWRTVRGMLPHKTSRGQAALDRLKVFEGVPAPYDKMKRVVVPEAYRITRLQPGRDYCRLGRLAHEVGWQHADLINKLEAKRKARSAAFHERRQELAKLKTKATANKSGELGKVNEFLAQYGQ